MSLTFIVEAIAECLVVASAFNCAVHLYRSSDKVTRPLPIVAILIIGVTTLTTSLPFIFPAVLTEFRRNLDAMQAGEWWRMVTPLFVQAYGWGQCCFNGVTAIFFLPLAEKFYGKKLLVLYFVSGIVGEIFNYTWNPTGAGSSLGIYGVMGALFVFTCRHRQEISRSTVIFAASGLCAALVSSLCHDGHGPSMLTGALLASMMRSRSLGALIVPPNNGTGC
jgi:membrane associated rhomboid family serine protease